MQALIQNKNPHYYLQGSSGVKRFDSYHKSSLRIYRVCSKFGGHRLHTLLYTIIHLDGFRSVKYLSRIFELRQEIESFLKAGQKYTEYFINTFFSVKPSIPM